MFNPFKKKDDFSSFKLDEESLPSMTEQNTGMSSYQNGSSDDYGMPNFDNVKTEQSFNSNPVSTNPTSLSAPSNPFASSSSPFTSSSMPVQSSNESNSSLHNDLAKAKLEMIESKVALIDAKIANMDHKIDMIYQLILSEVSDETKARFNVGNALNSLKKR